MIRAYWVQHDQWKQVDVPFTQENHEGTLAEKATKLGFDSRWDSSRASTPSQGDPTITIYESTEKATVRVQAAGYVISVEFLVIWNTGMHPIYLFASTVFEVFEVVNRIVSYKQQLNASVFLDTPGA